MTCSPRDDCSLWRHKARSFLPASLAFSRAFLEKKLRIIPSTTIKQLPTVQKTFVPSFVQTCAVSWRVQKPFFFSGKVGSCIRSSIQRCLPPTCELLNDTKTLGLAHKSELYIVFRFTVPYPEGHWNCEHKNFVLRLFLDGVYSNLSLFLVFS